MTDDDYLDEAGEAVYAALWTLKKHAKLTTYEEFLEELRLYCVNELGDGS